MSAADNSFPPAWQPLTPRGTASFAGGTFSRVFLVELIVGLVTASIVVWLLHVACSSVILDFIKQLPDGARYDSGELNGIPLPIQAEGKFLSLLADLEQANSPGQTADLQIQFGKRNCEACSLLGCFPLTYESRASLALGRSDLEPWWGAWRPVILAGAGLLALAVLFASWSILAALYCWLPKTIAYFADRDLSWGGSWRLASAALLPGTLFMGAALLFYGLQFIDLVRFGLLLGLHFVIGWIYLVISPFYLPRVSTSHPRSSNPFRPGQM